MRVNKKAVTAYSLSEQLPPFGFAEGSSAVQNWKAVTATFDVFSYRRLILQSRDSVNKALSLTVRMSCVGVYATHVLYCL